MKLLIIVVYNVIVYPLLFIISLIFSTINKKLRKSLTGKFRSKKRLKSYINSIPSNSIIYWFHASSLGEFYQIRPVIEKLKKKKNDARCLVSFTSPSGYEKAESASMDIKIYFPMDFPWTVFMALKLVKPKKIIFSSHDIWPNFVWIANKLGHHINITAYRTRYEIGGFSTFVRKLYESVFQSIFSVYTISEKDKRILQAILFQVDCPEISVFGNPRYDMVSQKAAEVENQDNSKILDRDNCIIIGSSHKTDDDIIIPPIAKLLDRYHDLRVIYVPHEPRTSELSRIERTFISNGHPIRVVEQSTSIEILKERVMVIAVVGVLFKLYWDARLAYIGGGYSSSGIHNVMEPAAAKLPVFFGPNYYNSDEAEQLLMTGGGFCVRNKDDFHDAVSRLLNDKQNLKIASLASSDIICKNIGATEKIVQGLIDE